MIRLTDRQILDAFPDEAKKLIPIKIKEWKEQIPDIKPILKRIENWEEFSQWFFKQILATQLDPEPFKQIKRLKALKMLMNQKADQKNIDIELLKQIPILSLYTFEKTKTFNRRIQALCPFHNEKTASFIIYPSNTFHCFGCLKSGDSIKFFMELNGYDFQTAIKQLSEGFYHEGSR